MSRWFAERGGLGWIGRTVGTPRDKALIIDGEKLVGDDQCNEACDV
jgi:hypothetical protein